MSLSFQGRPAALYPGNGWSLLRLQHGTTNTHASAHTHTRAKSRSPRREIKRDTEAVRKRERHRGREKHVSYSKASKQLCVQRCTVSPTWRKSTQRDKNRERERNPTTQWLAFNKADWLIGHKIQKQLIYTLQTMYRLLVNKHLHINWEESNSSELRLEKGQKRHNGVCVYQSRTTLNPRLCVCTVGVRS